MEIHYPQTGHLVEMAEEKRKNPTRAEKNFIDFCERMGIPYEFQVPIFCDSKGYILDFELNYAYNDNGKTREVFYVVEIDGGYHNLPEQQEKDKERTLDILQGKYKKVIRIPNKKTEDDDTLFEALYKGIPKTGKDGPAYRDFLQRQRGKGTPHIMISSEANAVLEALAKMEREILALRGEKERLIKTNWLLSKEVYDTKQELEKWKEKVEEVNNRIWRLSVMTGNYTYYKDDYAVDF